MTASANIGRYAWLALAAVFLPGIVAAQPVLNVDVALISHYLNRGELVVDAPVLQPQLEISSAGWSFNAWGNWDLTDQNDRRLEMTEAALTLAYGFDLNPVNLSVGVTECLVAEGAGTREVFIHAAMMLALNPAVGAYFDIDRIEGMLVEISAHHDVAVFPEVGLELRTALGYADAAANRDAFGLEQAALRDVNLGATLRYAFLPRVTLSVGALYWRLINTDVRAAAKDDAGIIWRLALQGRF